MLVVGVPPTTDHIATEALIDKHELDGNINYAELCA
jgi:hypothetical protein